MAKPKQLKVTLVKSKHGRLKSHKACVAGLGLRRIRHCVTVPENETRSGMSWYFSGGGMSGSSDKPAL